MTKGVKSDLQKVLDLIVASAEKRISSLPPKVAAAAREKIRKIASELAAQGARKTPKRAGNSARSASPRSRSKKS